MTTNQRTDAARAASRAEGVRAHERAQYATPPTIPTHLPTEQNTNSPSAVGGASVTREQSPDTHREPDDSRWLCAMRRTGTTVTLLDFTPEPVAAVLKSKPWARLVRGLGWSFPAGYLEHVERLLDGANVDLFDIDGDPTPAQRRRARETATADSRRVLDELRAARDAAEADPAATEQARREARAAFDQAIAAKHPERDDAEVGS